MHTHTKLTNLRKKIYVGYSKKVKDRNNFCKETNILIKNYYGYKKYKIVPLKNDFYKIETYTKQLLFIKNIANTIKKENVIKWYNTKTKQTNIERI